MAWANVTTCPSVGPPIFGMRGKITDKRVIQTIAHRVNDGHRLVYESAVKSKLSLSFFLPLRVSSRTSRGLSFYDLLKCLLKVVCNF